MRQPHITFGSTAMHIHSIEVRHCCICELDAVAYFTPREKTISYCAYILLGSRYSSLGEQQMLSGAPTNSNMHDSV